MKFLKRDLEGNPLSKVKFGFTLAEVLITLGIIGVIAACVIPTLLAQQEKQKTVTILKKNYSDILNASKQFSADYGCIDDLKCTGLFDFGHLNTAYFGYLLVHSYLKNVKDCGHVGNDFTCWAPKTYTYVEGFDTSFSNMADTSYEYKYMTPDGAAVLINSNMGSAHCQAWPNNTCLHITIDTNGPKPPNRAGRDTFFFDLRNKNGITLTQQGNPNSNGCGGSGTKYGPDCTSRVIKEGWQINY